MRSRPALFLLSAGIPLALGSCGLLRLPVRVAGAVVEGTASAGKTIGRSAAKPFARTPEEKAAAAKEKAEKDDKKREENEAKVRAQTDRHSAATRQENPAAPAEIPAAPVNEPLPDDSLPLPYDNPDALPPPPEGY
jgi:hypothetical protein